MSLWQSSSKLQSNKAIKMEHELDACTVKTLNQKIKEIRNTVCTKLPEIQFPAPYQIYKNMETVAISCIPSSKQMENTYRIPMIDEYFGDLKNIHKCREYNNNNVNITETVSTQSIENKDTKPWFYEKIYEALYAPNDEEYKKYKLFNEWYKYEMKDHLIVNGYMKRNKPIKLPHELIDLIHRFYSEILEHFTGDRVLAYIAFTGFAAHRTKPAQVDDYTRSCFVNDVTFLAEYDVRDGYSRYGAAAYFDQQYQLSKIFVATGKTYTPTDTGWHYAKWIWRVSATVAVFLVDLIAHCRLREQSGLIKAIQSTLHPNHPIRTLLLPFTFGTIYANRVYNEYLKRNGLLHRTFAFTYDSLSKLMEIEINNYKFYVLSKRVRVMKPIHPAIYPLYTRINDFWNTTLMFVTKYVEHYYNSEDGDDSLLLSDDNLVAFYIAFLENFGIPEKFRLKKFNIVNVLCHCICNGSIWSAHLSTAVSFDYSINPDLNALKIVDGMSGNSMQTYAEYCLVALCKGWNVISFDGMRKGRSDMNSLWKTVWEKDENVKHIFEKYFRDQMIVCGVNTASEEKQCFILYGTVNVLNPVYFCSSVML